VDKAPEELLDKTVGEREREREAERQADGEPVIR
jgi:hypothetical protein